MTRTIKLGDYETFENGQIVKKIGRTVKVGETVGFKSDIEQHGIIVGVETDRYRGDVLILEPATGEFEGEYIRGMKRTKVDAADCW